MFNLSRHLKLVLNRSSSINSMQTAIATVLSATSKRIHTAQRMAASTNQSASKRVLAIQSHVVHGYVGNKSATFPLQVSLIDF